MKKSFLSGPNIAGLIFILTVIIITVLLSFPKSATPTPLEKEQLLAAHERMLYFINAEVMAKKLFPESSARWSHSLDPTSLCLPLGKGFWVARGTVQIQKNETPVYLPWLVVFSPDRADPLFAGVGGIHSGDLSTTLHEVGRPELIMPGKDTYEK